MSADKLERDIQRELVRFLRARGWHVERMLANAFQTGIPDLYCYHGRGIAVGRGQATLRIPLTLSTAKNGPSGNEQASASDYNRCHGRAVRPHFQATELATLLETSFAVPTTADIDAMLEELASEDDQLQASVPPT